MRTITLTDNDQVIVLTRNEKIKIENVQFMQLLKGEIRFSKDDVDNEDNYGFIAKEGDFIKFSNSINIFIEPSEDQSYIKLQISKGGY